MNNLPRELIERILLFCNFDAWRRARFVCRMWAQICAECDWKTDEFVRYKCEDLTLYELSIDWKCSNRYTAYLPNGVKHGLSYYYFHKSEEILNMKLWVYGKEVLNTEYAFHHNPLVELTYTNAMKFHLLCGTEYCIVTISHNGEYHHIEFMTYFK